MHISLEHVLNFHSIAWSSISILFIIQCFLFCNFTEIRIRGKEEPIHSWRLNFIKVCAMCSTFILPFFFSIIGPSELEFTRLRADIGDKLPLGNEKEVLN